MTAIFEHGRYEINEESGGDLVIKDPNDNTVLRWDETTGNWAVPNQSVDAATDIAIKDYVDTVAQGLEWKESVIDELNDPPVSPSDGDRYLINDSPTGDWSGHPNEIAQYDGGTSSWTFTTPLEGWVVFIEDIDTIKYYDGSNWFAIGSAIDHGGLSGLSDDGHTQYLLVDGTRSMTGPLKINNDIIAQSVVASGSTTLSSGTATVDTGVSESTTATFTVALGPDTDGADIAADIRANSGGNYVVDIEETDTSVGNPTVEYDIIRVR